MDLTGTADKHGDFMRIVAEIYLQNPLQKKRIEGFLSSQPPEYWQFADELSTLLNHDLLKSEVDLKKGVEAYNQMCRDFLREQIQFRKSGEYRVESAECAARAVYHNKEVMGYYMKGLLLSYLFWPNHFRIFQFYREGISNFTIERCLEVGIGHGLFTAELMRRVPSVRPDVVDISETSIITAKELLRQFQVDSGQIRFTHGDYMKVPFEKGTFDFIVMGEVIEHVNDAPYFMQRTFDLLKPGGIVFLTTCANCPAIDHVYRFHNAREIRELMITSGFEILNDLALPAENVPEEKWEEELITINYCGFLRKKS